MNPQTTPTTSLTASPKRPREFTRHEATEMSRLAERLVLANRQRSHTSMHATLGELDAMFELKWRLNRLFDEASKG